MKKICAILFLLMSLSFVMAIDYPHAFRGGVEYNDGGGSVPDGYIVTGEVDGIIGGSCVIEDGTYDLIVKGGRDGDEVKFYIQGVEADQSVEFLVFEITDLDLTVDAVPEVFVGCGDEVCNNGEDCSTCSYDCGVCPCGNGICTGDESCSTCSADCGTCPVEDTGGDTGGGSSGGGGSSSSSSGGGGGSLPSSSNLQNIEVTNNDNLLSTQDDSQDNEFLSVDDLNQMEEERAKSSGITGAVTGFVKTGKGIASIVFVIGIVGAFVVASSIRKGKHK